MGQKNITSEYTEEIAFLEGRAPERIKINILPDDKQAIFTNLCNLQASDPAKYFEEINSIDSIL